MALQQYKQGSTYYGYDPSNNQGIAFSDPTNFNKYFGSFDQNAAAPTFDVSKLMAIPNQLLSLAPQTAPTPATPATPSTTPAMPSPATSMPQAPQTPQASVMPNTSALEADFQKLLQPSADELNAQNEVNNLQSSYRMGATNIQGKPIALEFQTGQLENLGRRYTDSLIPLQQRLALEQAKRQASLEASKFALDRADKQASQAKEESRYQSEITNAQAKETSTQQAAFANDIRQNANIILPFYKNPGSSQVYDSKTSQPLSYEQYKAMGGVGVPGMDKFPDVQEISTTNDKLLSPTEAARLGVPYGTTQSQAASQSITPAFGKTSTTKTTPTTKVTSADATSEIMGQWGQGYIQGNGKISSTDYKKGKEWWTSKGLSVSAFDNQFGYLIDKTSSSWKSDYGYGM